jgi:replicative DNA helicase
VTDDPGYTDEDAPREDGGDRTPPHNLLAEQSVLGSLMIDPKIIDDVTDVVIPAHFYFPKHEITASAIFALSRRGAAFDVIAVLDELKRLGMVERAGGDAYVHELTGIPTTSANAGWHAQIVQEDFRRRKLIEAGTHVVANGYASEGTVDDLVASALAELESAGDAKAAKLTRVGEDLLTLIESLDQKPNFTPTPWESVDKIMSGFAPGAVYVVAARPGQGKSIAALQIAVKLARTGLVAYCSLEMKRHELQMRMLSQFGEVHMTPLRNHTLSDMDFTAIARARVAIQDAPIFIDDSPVQTIASIRSHARQVAKRGHLAGVVVDYMTLIAEEGNDRRVVVDRISRAVKMLAGELNVPVIVAAQLKRAIPNRGSMPEPTLEALRESGAIEQDADVVMLLHRDAAKDPRRVKFIVAKNRHGDMGHVTLNWQAEFARFQDRGLMPPSLISEEEAR